MIDFIISSGLITDMAAIPVPDFAVPYAAPSAIINREREKTIINGKINSTWKNVYNLIKKRKKLSLNPLREFIYARDLFSVYLYREINVLFRQVNKCVMFI